MSPHVCDLCSVAEFVVESIKKSLNTGKYDSDHSVAIIYRTNAQSRALEEACVKNNLPYVIFGSATSFYKRQEIKDTLCFLRWLHNGRDRTSMLRAMTTPKRGIGEAAIAEFESYCSVVEDYFDETYPGRTKPSSLDVLLSLSDHPETKTLGEFPPSPVGYISSRPLKLFKEFSSQMRLIRTRALKEPLQNVLSTIIDEFELIKHFDKISKSNSEYEERKANVNELQQAAQRYTAGGPCLRTSGSLENEEFIESPLGSFLDDVSLVTDLADRSSGERFVANFMTIHASKGMVSQSALLLVYGCRREL